EQKKEGIVLSKATDGNVDTVAAAGGLVNYSVLIENTSAAALSRIVLTDALARSDAGSVPAGTYVSESADGKVKVSVTSGGALLLPSEYYEVTEQTNSGFRLEFDPGRVVLASGAALQVNYAIRFPANGPNADITWTNTADVAAVPEGGGLLLDKDSFDIQQPKASDESGGGGGNTGGGGGGTTPGGNTGGDDGDTGDNNTGGGGSDDTGGDTGTWTPGGNDPNAPPNPTAPGHSLIPGEGGVYIELDENGVPLGEWRWDDPTEQWIFDEYPPLENLPQTGGVVRMGFTHLWMLPLLALLWFGLVWPRLRRRIGARAR
ncbi:MAG: hypothetical protein LBP73_01315, partial [Clostridiales Family XIII bacterium]|nr:hypothetical protein [Clostridiales Family XIII bacterium]